MLDIFDKESSLPELVAYLEKAAKSKEELPGIEISLRTLVSISRYLKGWGGLYTQEKDKPPRLTTEGAFLLHNKWTGEKKNAVHAKTKRTPKK